MVEHGEAAQVLIPVVDVVDQRQIGWGSNVTELLQSRLDDIRAAVGAGAESVASTLDSLPVRERWQIDQVSTTFGITLAAEAGVILSKASTEATFEVTITFARCAPGSPGH